jgi:hypothetical protein
VNSIFVDIERIVLTDLVLSPARAERLRGLVALELQHFLKQEGLADGLVNSEVSDLSVPMIHPSELQNDNRLASTLAQRVASALRVV